MTTIVLSHGPFADASSWTGVIKETCTRRQPNERKPYGRAQS